ncbi:MAG: imidazole glycerol phosphate synthase subunit HisH [Lachnospiraceae bacterium]|nr:imidazole glycerol phosphate synthase subunit HisH [Lachnospiraceae bacterium]
MIVILDYEMGNVGSIQNILNKVGQKDVLISRDPDVIEKADKLILPGVGAFDTGMINLKKFHLVEPIIDFAQNKKKPLLGICLGMQLLGRSSEEGKEKGLGLIPFDNIRFQLDSNYKIPHMGWNYIEIVDENAPIVRNLDRIQRYYFVHSYHARCDDASNVLMTCNYGYPFAAAVVKAQIYGVQFHPEKSHQFGMQLLKNFVEECAQ